MSRSILSCFSISLRSHAHNRTRNCDLDDRNEQFSKCRRHDRTNWDIKTGTSANSKGLKLNEVSTYMYVEQCSNRTFITFEAWTLLVLWIVLCGECVSMVLASSENKRFKNMKELHDGWFTLTNSKTVNFYDNNCYDF